MNFVPFKEFKIVRQFRFSESSSELNEDSQTSLQFEMELKKINEILNDLKIWNLQSIES